MKKVAKPKKGPDEFAAELAKIEKRYSDRRLKFARAVRSFVPTPFPRLNHLLGGGLLEGGIVEVFGQEGTSKTSLALALAHSVQAEAPTERREVVMVNFEKFHDFDWWQKLFPSLVLSVGADGRQQVDPACGFHELRPDTLEEGVGDLTRLVSTGRVCCVLVDSVAAAQSSENLEVVRGWTHDRKTHKRGIAVDAKKWNQSWGVLKDLFVDHGTVAIAVNQWFEDIGGGAPGQKSWIKTGHSPRGRALKFYSWVRLELSARSLDPARFRDGEDGRNVRIKVVKNKQSSAALDSVRYDLIRGEGWDLAGAIIDEAVQVGVLKGAGAGRFEVVGTGVVIRGEERLRLRAREDPEFREQLRRAIDEKLASAPAPDAEGEASGSPDGGDVDPETEDDSED